RDWPRIARHHHEVTFGPDQIEWLRCWEANSQPMIRGIVRERRHELDALRAGGRAHARDGRAADGLRRPRAPIRPERCRQLQLARDLELGVERPGRRYSRHWRFRREGLFRVLA